jgi:Uma2 family endonuclease
MSTVARPLMTVEQFLAWAEGRDGRWELQDGELVAMAPERQVHAETKYEVVAALKAAIRRANAPCHAVPDGATVRIAARTAFEPDALVYCGPRLPPDTIEIPEPLMASSSRAISHCRAWRIVSFSTPTAAWSSITSEGWAR